MSRKSKKKVKGPSSAHEITEEEQLRVLQEAKKNVANEAWKMKRCLDTSKLMEALKHASAMISELRTSLLSPKNYYDLYMCAFDEMRHLEVFLDGDSKAKGKKLNELYEVVQYAGNILPRLYLLVTVGSVYIKEREAPAKDVLRDLVEMCRGVQHPTRGLFLRNYLSEISKDKLPDAGSEYEGSGGSVTDSIHFILQNFIEMNKLWVRMQHQGPVIDKKTRETERKDLRLLVGKNLSRLSMLDGVDLEAYKTIVLPKVLEQIVGCKDVIAQQYLMEVVIQVFPDMFHLHTLEPLLATLLKLQPAVDVRVILCSLVERLTQFAISEEQRDAGIPDSIPVFQLLYNYISQLTESRKMTSEDSLALFVSLLSLALQVYPEKLPFVDKTLSSALELLEGMSEGDYTSPECVTQIKQLLHLPLQHYTNVLTALGHSGYSTIIGYLSYVHRKRVAVEIVKGVIKNETAIPSPNDVTKLFVAIAPLLTDQDDQDQVDKEEHTVEQNLVASLIHLFSSENPEQLYMIYVRARKVFGKGGKTRITHTLVPLVYKCLELVRSIKDSGADPATWERVGERVFKFTHETITALSRSDFKELSLRLLLQTAREASNCNFEALAYHYLTEVFEIYESDIADSKAQFNALTEIIGTLHGMDVFGEDNYDALVTKTAVHCAKLLKKPDQCRAVYLVSHLFWGTSAASHQDGKRVLECLQKALKIADACVESSSNVQLFVEILNKYLFYYAGKNQAVAVKYLSGLIALIKTNMGGIDESEVESVEELNAARKHFANTLHHITVKQEDSSPSGIDYTAIEL